MPRGRMSTPTAWTSSFTARSMTATSSRCRRVLAGAVRPAGWADGAWRRWARGQERRAGGGSDGCARRPSVLSQLLASAARRPSSPSTLAHLALPGCLPRCTAADHGAVHHASDRQEGGGPLAAPAQGGRQAGAKHQGAPRLACSRLAAGTRCCWLAFSGKPCWPAGVWPADLLLQRPSCCLPPATDRASPSQHPPACPPAAGPPQPFPLPPPQVDWDKWVDEDEEEEGGADAAGGFDLSMLQNFQARASWR